MRVAWVGLGSMGAPMALSVLRGGHRLVGYARRPGEHDAIRAAGGIVIDRLDEALANAEIVCLNLFSEAQIRAVMIEGGGLDAIAADAILIVHSTVGPAFVRALADLRPDIAILDAGFSGSPDDALAGRLTLMVGGVGTVLERARPILDAYADHVAHVGSLGAGMALKLVNNLMFAAHVAIAADGLRLVREEGLDADMAVATLMRGSAGSNALALLGRARDPAVIIAAIRPYLDKDVTAARHAAGERVLGVIGVATEAFGERRG